MTTTQTHTTQTVCIPDDRLLGAAEFLQAYQGFTIDTLKSRKIDVERPSILVEVHRMYPAISSVDDGEVFNINHQAHYETQCHDNLYAHLRYLQHEFIGQSELVFYHTLLIVLLRRGYQPEQTFRLFDALWQAHAAYFFAQLSLRWLISAADTFVDFSDSTLRRAILMNGVSLINTLKAYETQRFLLTDNTKPLAAKVDALYAKHEALYDGLTFLRLGSDDTIEQMHRRFLRFKTHDAFATEFLLTIFYRLHDHPSAYALFKAMHTEDWGYQWEDIFKKGEK